MSSKNEVSFAQDVKNIFTVYRKNRRVYKGNVRAFFLRADNLISQNNKKEKSFAKEIRAAYEARLFKIMTPPNDESLSSVEVFKAMLQKASPARRRCAEAKIEAEIACVISITAENKQVIIRKRKMFHHRERHQHIKKQFKDFGSSVAQSFCKASALATLPLAALKTGFINGVKTARTDFAAVMAAGVSRNASPKKAQWKKVPIVAFASLQA